MEPTHGAAEAFKALHRIQELETDVLELLDKLFEMRVEIVTTFYGGDGPERDADPAVPTPGG